MPVQTTYPGVYVQELPSSVHTIVGVSTSVTTFIGRAPQGPIDKPVQCLSYNDFVRAFTADISFSDLPRQVYLFFMNGGTECYVMRVVSQNSSTNGDDAVLATVTLNDTGGTPTLVISANSPGAWANTMQLTVDYNNTKNPEAVFNLTIYALSTAANGQQKMTAVETWPGLSMDPTSPMYAVTYITQNSDYITAALPNPSIPPTSNPGYSQGGRLFTTGNATTTGTLASAINKATGTDFIMSVNGGAGIKISLPVASLILALATDTEEEIIPRIQTIINQATPSGTVVTVTTAASGGSLTTPPTVVPGPFYLQFRNLNGNVNISPAPTNDISAILMLGTNQGGVEVSNYSNARPTPNGVVFNIDSLYDFANLKTDAITSLQVNGMPTTAIPFSLLPAIPGLMSTDTNGDASVNGNSDGIRQKWGIFASAISKQNILGNFPWVAQVWGSRLAILPAVGSTNSSGVLLTSGSVADSANLGQKSPATPIYFSSNLSYYPMGGGIDGGKPGIIDYQYAFGVLDTEVPIFNLMALAKDNSTSEATDLTTIWGPASVFCQQKLAFLLIDPPDSPDGLYSQNNWSTVQQATDPSTGVNALRIGLVNDHSALFFPRITKNENGLTVPVGPSGAIAGLMARTDSNSGVWTAPAGTNATLNAVSGVQYKFTDAQNGVLNPAAINTIRLFPDGLVNWGARTMDGDDSFGSQWKYIPVRRTALYIEQSLYLGLKWVVFKPNDENLWAMVRLNVKAFMQDLFRQGAFQSITGNWQDSYFIQCDSSNNPQSQIDLGIVNITVGFAPLIPAEFVIISLQQMAGNL